jgi:hypothetical protein
MRHRNEAETGFQQLGYGLLKSLVAPEDIDTLRRLIYQLFCKLAPEAAGNLSGSEPWNIPEFDLELIALRKRDPALFGLLYDCTQNSPLLQRMVTSPQIQEQVAVILKTDPESLACSGIMLRMDCPQDKRNALRWHQDHTYYPQNKDGSLGLVLTIALQDIDVNMGALKVRVGSHVKGLVEAEVEDNPDYNMSLQRVVPAKEVELFDEVDAVLEKGDGIAIHMDMFHRSGDNNSNQIRFSALCRFHSLMEADYVPHRLRHEFDQNLLEKVYSDRPKGLTEITGR